MNSLISTASLLEGSKNEEDIKMLEIIKTKILELQALALGIRTGGGNEPDPGPPNPNPTDPTTHVEGDQ